MMDKLLAVFLLTAFYAVCVLMASASIGIAVRNFKKGSYFWFGFDCMVTFIFAVRLLELMLKAI